MFRYIGEQPAYSFFGSLSVVLSVILSICFYKSKRNSISLFSKLAVCGVSKRNKTIGKIVEIILVSVESASITAICTSLSSFNEPFGELVGTGANYFGLLLAAPIVVFIISLVIVSNPIKQVDFISVILPFMLVFIKLSCFGNGCCWGIDWEYGLYNYHPDHPGKQVPVQAIEAFWALAIFVFFLWYRKKAKRGTMFPMYMILFCATRFCSEFFRREENVLWIFKTYHLLCIAGFVIGLVLLLLMRKYGESLSDFFEKPHIKFEQKVATYEETKSLEQMKIKAKAEADEAERLEKVKIARAKAKARKK